MEKNVKLIFSIFIMILIFSFSSISLFNENSRKKIKSDNWINLFDGKSFNGWHQYNGSKVSNKWSVKNGIMIFDPNKKVTSNDGSGNIVSDKEYTNFELSLEWNVAEGGNSGLFWGVKELKELSQPYLTGPEIQILDNDRHPDAKANPKFHQAGALYDMVQPKFDVCNPAGQWNLMILKIDHSKNKGSVKLNGIEIVVFPLAGPKWYKMVSKSKFASWSFFGSYKTGKIGFQDHGDKVSFRNIKIREL